jgi:hypothetical protein
MMLVDINDLEHTNRGFDENGANFVDISNPILAQQQQ